MKSSYDIVIVGGGPAGTVAARYAAQEGVSVLLLEKDRDLGYPVRCGEAIAKDGLTQFIEPDKRFISAEISKFIMVAPNGKDVSLEFHNVLGYVLERRIFDYELGKIAANEGAEIITKAYCNGLIIENGKVCGVKYQHNGNDREVRCKVVIAADGVESRVGRWAGIKTHIHIKDMESCAQLTIANANIDKNALYFYFGKNIAPGGYFWVFPKANNSANVGLGINGLEGKNKSAIKYLYEFLEKHYPNTQILTQVAGGDPCSVTLDKISAPGIMLVGDAARHVNPLSGGGIASGMISGSIAGRIAGASVKQNKLNNILNYDKEWHDRLGKRHETFDSIKNGIYNFSDDKFNSIAESFLKVPKDKRTLRTLFTTALFNNPSLIIDVAKVFI